MARILNAHESIMIGEERYEVVFTKGLPRDAFEAPRFLDIRPGDTHYRSFEDIGTSLSAVRSKLAGATVVGDKIPKIYERLRQTADTFPEAKFIFMVRNLYDIACSYESRAKDPNDPTWSSEMNWRSAIAEWNESLAAIKAWPGQDRILIVSFEDFFLLGRGLDTVWGFLGLRSSSGAAREFETRRARIIAHGDRKAGFLDPLARRAILCEGNFDDYRYVLRQQNCIQSIPERSCVYSLRRGMFSGGITLKSGWSLPEAAGVWTKEATAELILQLAALPSRTAALRIIAEPFFHANRSSRALTVEMNGTNLGAFTFERAGPRLVEIAVPAGTLALENHIQFTIEEPEAPARTIGGPDSRLLGFQFQEIRIY
jgi:Sulfotransferase family